MPTALENALSDAGFTLETCASALSMSPQVLLSMAKGFQPVTPVMVRQIAMFAALDQGDVMRLFPIVYAAGVVTEEAARQLGVLPFEEQLRYASTGTIGLPPANGQALRP